MSEQVQSQKSSTYLAILIVLFFFAMVVVAILSSATMLWVNHHSADPHDPEIPVGAIESPTVAAASYYS